MYRIFLVALLSLSGSMAHAMIDSTPSGKTEKQALDVASRPFADQLKSIEADLADGETYSEIGNQDRATVRGALQRIASALESVGGNVNQLSASAKAEVFNEQELANNILTRAGEDSRLICKREKKVGSHRTSTQCATVAERRRAAEQSEKALRENQRIQMPASG